MSEAEEILDVHFFHRHVPNWVVVMVFFLIVTAVISVVFLYRQNLRYSLYVSADGGSSRELTYGAWPALQDIHFFNRVRDDFISQKADFIEADLSAGMIRLYQGGKVVKGIPILSQGREGSWWETPAGLYRVEAKEPDHFSSLGHVNMPWSMPFQGNFFIHGWPTYPDGQPVPPGYSGGCIRLGTEDAKWLYDSVKVGTPILVYKESSEKDSFKYELRPPSVQAGSFLAADVHSGFVLTGKAREVVLPIASITKLMTALVATEYMNIEQEITIRSEMIVETSRPRLFVGQRVRVFDLLDILLQESSNEAAEALAQGYRGGRDQFVRLMNEKAKAIGLADSVFADPSGVSSENKSNTRDLFVLARYLYDNRRFVLSLSNSVVDNQAYEVPNFDGVQNYNVFKGVSGFVGGKVGYSSSALGTILSVFELNLNGEKRPIVIVLLSSPDYETEARTLVDWIKKNY